MTRLPINRGITQVEEDKSLILRSLCSLRLNHAISESLIYPEPLPNLEITSADILRQIPIIRHGGSRVKLKIKSNHPTNFARGVLLTRSSKLSIERNNDVKKVIAVNLNPNIPKELKNLNNK